MKAKTALILAHLDKNGKVTVKWIGLPASP